MRKFIAAAAAFLFGAGFPVPARADGAPVVVWPTLTPAGDAASTVSLHKPIVTERRLAGRAAELDATLRDAVQDLGFTLNVAGMAPEQGAVRDIDLLEKADQGAGSWVVSPRIEAAGGDEFMLRMIAVPPHGRELRVRVERVHAADLSVRGLVLLRALLAENVAAQAASDARDRAHVNPAANVGVLSDNRSAGRVVLALNAALFGGYSAFSIQRASGSDDPRVRYPLLAIGTGAGVGAALLVAEEWDVTPAAAWFLTGGAWWSAGAGLLLANGRNVQPFDDRYAWGVGGGLTGVTLATVALAARRRDEGDAALLHSGAALGLFAGGAAELAVRGAPVSDSPSTGAGIGTAAGLVGAGALATFVRVSASRVFLIDLGAGVGALAGSAVGSPLLFEDQSKNKRRAFLGATLGGTLVGGGVAWWFTRNKASLTPSPEAQTRITPIGGVIGTSETATGAVPAYGVGVRGAF